MELELEQAQSQRSEEAEASDHKRLKNIYNLQFQLMKVNDKICIVLPFVGFTCQELQQRQRKDRAAFAARETQQKLMQAGCAYVGRLKQKQPPKNGVLQL